VKRGFPKKWAIAFYVALAAATLAVLVAMHLARDQVPPLSPDERQDLAVIDELDGKQLRHPMLGFALAHPGPKFFQSPEAEARLGFGHDRSTRFHAFTELDSGRMVIVALSRRPGMGEDAFAEAVHSVTHMFTQRTAAGYEAGIAVDVMDQKIDLAARRADTHVRFHGLGHMRLHARVSKFAGEVDYMLVVITISPQDDSLASLIASLRAT
jgi:hypothetical protein